MTDGAFNGAVRGAGPGTGRVMPPGGESVAGLLEHIQSAIAFERERADRAEAELAALSERVGAVIAAAGAADRRRAEAAEAKVAEYENAVLWDTSCTSCAQVLDSCTREREGREHAEAEVARLRALLEARPAEVPGA